MKKMDVNIYIYSTAHLFWRYTTPTNVVSTETIFSLYVYTYLEQSHVMYLSWFFPTNKMCVRHKIGVHKSLNLFKSRRFRSHETIWWNCYLYLFHKVQLFWEGHKNECNPPFGFWNLLSKRQNHKDDFANSCGLLRKAEFYFTKIMGQVPSLPPIFCRPCMQSTLHCVAA